ncbi:glycosyltransferase [Fimbriiglobus ruber]|uniref:RhlB, TDP-rhamnosyltransferase 1 n=1 Tax=Fimbriiglobus ruber TaxID=1908690 RepID=A0A225DFR5_9BACT|nr:nucleotide disphospho-sugar-binding domain-containing protein [Fimbriiglobus ruber]OWK40411.1 RhlB, TDP-rhamnosyltransferase 1 [Fimbriiglobus ruber]
MHVLLNPVGSHGDVHPFIGLGRALAARGHQITLITAAPFRGLAEANGWAFAQVGTDDFFETMIGNPDLWHPRKSISLLFSDSGIPQTLRESFAHIQSRYVRGDTVLVAGSLGMAARIAYDALGIPLATVHLQPSLFASVEAPPVFATVRFRGWWPSWFRRFLYWFGDRALVDPKLGPHVNAFRQELGLAPVRRILGRWLHSPQRVIGFFPDWYGSAGDWPPQVRTTGFVFYDREENQELPPNVRSFLDAGTPPVVFTFGSAMRFAGPYFAVAVEACRRLGIRGLLLGKGRDVVPPDLPASVLHAEYAPFSLVLPRAAAVVHHGGIGTSAQAMQAGIRQLIVPFAFDQPDNADRLARLGVARVVYPRAFNTTNVATELKTLLTAPEVDRACQVVAARFAGTDPLEETCRLVEELRGTDRPVA